MKIIKQILLMALMIGLALYVIGNLHVFGAPTPDPAASKPCTDKPCIEITYSGGDYKLNDFRFLPNRCVKFISMPDGVDRHYCGDYKLRWIGPTR